MIDDADSVELSIKLLGVFDCRIGERPIGPLRSRKTSHLLAILVLKGQRAISRSWIAGQLWPDSTEERALFYLRRELSELRRSLGNHAWRIQSPSRDLVSFEVEGSDVDLSSFDGKVGSTDPETLVQAVNLYRGPLLEGLDEEWILLDRSQREQEFVRALADLAQHDLERGDPTRAMVWLRRAIAQEPLRESLHRMLFSALGRLRDYGELVKCYRSLKSVLGRELGVGPDRETRELVHRIRQEAKEQAYVESVPAFSASRRLNAPPALTIDLIGRESELNQLAVLVESHRAVVLTGLGGIGKTSLAIATAGRIASRFTDGVTLAKLASVSSDALVASEVAQALGVIEQSRQSIEEAIVDRLAGQRHLLILDNCEQVAAGCRRLIEFLASRCESARILATSRHTLSGKGLFNWRVPPLPSPSPTERSSASDSEMEAILASPAVRCFCDHAARLGAVIEVTRENVASIAQVCSRLDGIPLALELAAARVPSMSLRQIEEKLSDRFRLLSYGSDAEDARQATLLAAVEWSFALLSRQEQRLLSRLAVFADGWTLEAAEEICSDGELPQAQIDILLASLVDKSLVNFKPAEPEGRFRFLETLREFALLRLSESGESIQLRQRHLDYYCRHAGDYSALLYGSKTNEALQILDAELSNLRAAQAFCLELPPDHTILDGTSAAAASLRIVNRRFRFDYIRGYLEEGRTQAILALERARPGDSEVEFGWASMAAALLLSFQGRMKDACRYYDSALQLAVKTGDRTMAIRTLQNHGWTLFRMGLIQEATSCFDEALSMALQDSNFLWQAVTLSYLSGIDVSQERSEVALAKLAMAESAIRGQNNDLIESLVNYHYGSAYFGTGDFAGARGRLTAAIAKLRSMGDAFHLSTALMIKAKLDLAERRLRDSKECLSEALNRFDSIGSEFEAAQCLEITADLAIAVQDYDSAAMFHSAAASMRLQLEAPPTPAERKAIERAMSMLSAAGALASSGTMENRDARLPFRAVVAHAVNFCREGSTD